MFICCLIKPAIQQALTYQLLVLLARGSGSSLAVRYSQTGASAR